MVIKKLDDTSNNPILSPLQSSSTHPTQTASISKHIPSSTSTNFNNNSASQEIKINNYSNKKFNLKTNLNKFISNSDILVKFDSQHKQQGWSNDAATTTTQPTLPQRIFYENILSDLKNNQKSTLAYNHINSNSTSSLNEQYILNFNHKNQIVNNAVPSTTTLTTNTRCTNNQSNINLFKHENSSTDEGLDEFIDEFNLEDDDDDFGSSLSTTSSSSRSDANQANNKMVRRKSSDQQTSESLPKQQPPPPTLLASAPLLPTSFSNSNSSLSISDLSVSPLSLTSNQTAGDQTTSQICNFTTISVETDLNEDATNDVCLLTPTQFTSFREKGIEGEKGDEDEGDDEDSRRNTVTYSTSSLLHEYQAKNNILNTATNVENNDVAFSLDHDQNNILLLRSELLNADKNLSRQESKSKDSKLSSGKSTISSANSLFLACEVASLSSLTSDYSQFDFLATTNNNNNNLSSTSSTNKIVLPVTETYHVDTPSKKSSSNTNSNGSLTSFFFSNR